MNGVGTRTYVAANAPPGGSSLLAGISTANTSSLGFASTQPAAPVSGPRSSLITNSSYVTERASFAITTVEVAPMTMLTMRTSVSGGDDPGSIRGGATSSGGVDELSQLLAAQDGDGAFSSNEVKQIVFPSSGIPAVPAFISALDGRENVKDQIWVTICAIAFLQNKFSSRSGEWSSAKTKAEKFVTTTLHCVFGVDSSR